MPVIANVIADETWLEGERRGCYVSPNDSIARANVCGGVLPIGEELRAQVTRELGVDFRAAWRLGANARCAHECHEKAS